MESKDFDDILEREVVSAQTQFEFDANEEKDKEIESLKNANLYLRADLYNVRKQNAKRLQEVTKTATEGLLKDLLPVLDDLNRAQASFEVSDDKDSLKSGVDIVFNKLKSILTSNGLEEIKTEGVFDTSVHEAIAQVPSEYAEHGEIIDCIEKGYKLNGKVIRYAKVAVAV